MIASSQFSSTPHFPQFHRTISWAQDEESNTVKVHEEQKVHSPTLNTTKMLCPEFEATHVTGPILDSGSKTSGQSCGLAPNISFKSCLVPSDMGVLCFWGICKSICGFSNCVFPTATISARSSLVSVNESFYHCPDGNAQGKNVLCAVSLPHFRAM